DAVSARSRAGARNDRTADGSGGGRAGGRRRAGGGGDGASRLRRPAPGARGAPRGDEPRLHRKPRVYGAGRGRGIRSAPGGGGRRRGGAARNDGSRERGAGEVPPRPSGHVRVGYRIAEALIAAFPSFS